MRNESNIIGNNYVADDSLGFKAEVSSAFESYRGAGVSLSADFMKILTSPEAKADFIDMAMESVATAPALTQGVAANTEFYDNYGARLAQLMDNSLTQVAQESVMLGYAPIVAYNPFFLKKQWVANVFKDVLMSEIPTNALINIGYEKRYVKTMDGKEYAIPDVNYDDAAMEELMNASTGLNISDAPIEIDAFSPSLAVLTNTYVPGIVEGDPSYELTQDIAVQAVYMTVAGAEVAVPCNIRVDMTTHNFVKGKVKYTAEDGTVTEDELFGNVDFQNGRVVLRSREGKITKVVLKGKISNRFNQRSLDVERRVEQFQFVMPESGPRLNSAITVEEATDAMATQKIDLIADKADTMGRTLAELQDFGIRSYLNKSFQDNLGLENGPYGFGSMVKEASFDALPYDGYTSNITNWMVDVREYFERLIQALKDVLVTPNVVINVVGHPSLVRFLQAGIQWVFTDSTQISGMKISYDFGILTTSQDKVHIITSHYMKPEQGLRFVVIPTSNDIITFKHYWQNVVIDRGYRHPVFTLTPNIMCTQRTLTFDIYPVQGNLYIDGRDLFSPDTLKRATDTPAVDTPVEEGTEAGA